MDGRRPRRPIPGGQGESCEPLPRYSGHRPFETSSRGVTWPLGSSRPREWLLREAGIVRMTTHGAMHPAPCPPYRTDSRVWLSRPVEWSGDADDAPPANTPPGVRGPRAKKLRQRNASATCSTPRPAEKRDVGSRDGKGGGRSEHDIKQLLTGPRETMFRQFIEITTVNSIRLTTYPLGVRWEGRRWSAVRPEPVCWEAPHPAVSTSLFVSLTQEGRAKLKVARRYG